MWRFLRLLVRDLSSARHLWVPGLLPGPLRLAGRACILRAS
jgi:hypothetical protein